MRIFEIFIFVTILLMLGIGLASAQISKDDISGFSTLLVSPAARQAAMGEAGGASDGSLFALYSNPAGILGIPFFTAGAAHNQWIADYRSEFAAVAYHPSSFAIGFSINYGTVGDIERRSGPSDDPEGYFDLNDIVAGLTLAKQVGPGINLGLTTKIIYEKIDIYSATGIAFDLGAQYQAMPGLTLGASFSNLGSKLKLDEKEYDLPKLLRAGASYRIYDFLISGDVVYPTDDDPHVHVGGEYNINQMIFLRGGFQSGYDEKALSFGIGFEQKGFNIDYAYVPFKSDLGDTHRLSLIYSLLKED